MRVRAIEFARGLHAAKVRCALKLATLSLNARMGFSIAEKQLTLGNAEVGILHSSQTKSQAWQKFVQCQSVEGQCVIDRCKQFTGLINIDAGTLMTTNDNQQFSIVEKWLPNEVVVIDFDAQYNQTAEVLLFALFHILSVAAATMVNERIPRTRCMVCVLMNRTKSSCQQNYALLRAEVDVTAKYI